LPAQISLALSPVSGFLRQDQPCAFLVPVALGALRSLRLNSFRFPLAVKRQLAANSFRITSFADSSCLTPVESHLYKNPSGIGGSVKIPFKFRFVCARCHPEHSEGSAFLFPCFFTSLCHYFSNLKGNSNAR